jgi:tetratricopeptide (TPR) repeat protein
MRIVRSLAVVLLIALASPAFAVMGGGSSNPQPNPSTDIQATEKADPRLEAEKFYADGYEEVAKAKKDIANGKTKNVGKRFKKALERGESAVALAPDYHEAWNLVGYSARQLKDYERSIAAYEKCLAIKPDYAPAREYLGETYVETGDVTNAKIQLGWLEKLNEKTMVESLRAQIDAWEKAHPSGPAPTEADPKASTGGGAGR